VTTTLLDAIREKALTWDCHSDEEFFANFIQWCDEDIQFVLAVTDDDYSQLFKFASEAWAHARAELNRDYDREARDAWNSRL